MTMLSRYYKDRRTPDILDCIANLSSDEVFTPPELADKVLDLLPDEVWSNPDLKWLDPACKTGIFLRQIAGRLMEGLKEKIPDEEKRREHIFKKMLFGMPITTITGMVSRRSVYYAKDATSEMSVVKMDSPDGNIKFMPMEHTFRNGKCTMCGLSEKEEKLGGRQIDGSLENHAYEFIHLRKEEIKKMHFDVIVGNPPYSLGDGGGNGSSATPIYQHFIEQAKKLGPRYMAFIIPSRWFAGGKGLDDFRNTMLKDSHVKKIVDYPNASDCFPGVEIKGGVCYFIWDGAYNGDCEIITIIGEEESAPMKRPLNEFDIFVRWNEAISILRKVQSCNEKTLDTKVSSRKPFNFTSNFSDYDQINNPDKVKIYALGGKSGYILREKVQINKDLVDKPKVLLAKAGPVNGTFPNNVIGTIFAVEPPSVCTETYLVAGVYPTMEQAKNYIQYLKTKFARFLILLKTPTQNMSKGCFSFVPDLPMDKKWTDIELYERYNLSQDEINFIEKMIKEM